MSEYGPVTGRVVHQHQPRATEVDVDVAATTTGHTLAVKVGLAAREGESDQDAVQRAVQVSVDAYAAAVAAYQEIKVVFGPRAKGAA